MDDLPLPEAPTTASNRSRSSRWTICSVARSRPKNSGASRSSNLSRPLYGALPGAAGSSSGAPVPIGPNSGLQARRGELEDLDGLAEPFETLDAY